MAKSSRNKKKLIPKNIPVKNRIVTNRRRKPGVAPQLDVEGHYRYPGGPGGAQRSNEQWLYQHQDPISNRSSLSKLSRQEQIQHKRAWMIERDKRLWFKSKSTEIHDQLKMGRMGVDSFTSSPSISSNKSKSGGGDRGNFFTSKTNWWTSKVSDGYYPETSNDPNWQGNAPKSFDGKSKVRYHKSSSKSYRPDRSKSLFKKDKSNLDMIRDEGKSKLK